MKKMALIVVCVVLTACAGTPEDRAYRIAAGHAEWQDRFERDRRACESSGGVIAQERHQPDSIRIGAPRVEVGTRYWCVY